MNKPPTIQSTHPRPGKCGAPIQRVRHFGLLANRWKKLQLERCFQLVHVTPAPSEPCPSGPKHTHHLSGLPLRFDDRVAHIITRFLGFFMMVRRTGPTPFLYIWDCESHGHRMTLSVFQGTCEGAQTKRCAGMIRKQEERAARAPTCSQFLRNIPPHAFLRTVQNP